MKIISEFDILTIVGNWNQAIITPDWVSKYLLPGEKLKVEYPKSPIEALTASLRISTENFRFYVSPGRFNFTIINHSDTVYLKIGDIALNIAKYLMHTPVTSFGLNYLYESDATDELEPFFLIPDSNSIMNTIGIEAEETQIKRSFKMGDCVLNFNVVRSDKYRFDFNYDFKVESLVEFKDKFEPNKLIEYKNNSQGLLSELYNLEV